LSSAAVFDDYHWELAMVMGISMLVTTMTMQVMILMHYLSTYVPIASA
jgi:hypothetical protein